jgi:tetratricopeptide (TPR) repeat protein
VAVAQTVPTGRPTMRLLSAAVVVFIWLLASAKIKRWFFGDRLRQRLREGHFAEVAELYAPAFEQSQSPAARVRMALLMSVCELERDRPGEARAWLDRVDAGGLDGTTRAILLSQRARALADEPGALEVAEEGVKLSRGGPNEVAALTSRGIVHLRAGRARPALADLEKANELAITAGNEVPYLAAGRARFLGEAYLAAGDPERARAAFTRAAAYPRHIPAAKAAVAALARLPDGDDGSAGEPGPATDGAGA